MTNYHPNVLAETANAARDNLGVDQIDVVADRDYHKIEDIEDCEASRCHAPYVGVTGLTQAIRA